jgi:hypothetical protein
VWSDDKLLGSLLSLTVVTLHHVATLKAQYLFDGAGIEQFWVAETGCGDDHFSDNPTNPTPPAWTDRAGDGYRYNHATFMDLVLSGVVGLQPHANGTLVVNPLVPTTELTYWAADGIALHGKMVTVFFVRCPFCPSMISANCTDVSGIASPIALAAREGGKVVLVSLCAELASLDTGLTVNPAIPT